MIYVSQDDNQLIIKKKRFNDKFKFNNQMPEQQKKKSHILEIKDDRH
jgi:hypothetical protein